jgi:DNA-binding Lrp family transcriptional regulator
MPTAFVCVNSDRTPVPELLKQVKAVEGVEEPEMVYGLYDICFKVKGETQTKLNQIIVERIKGLEHVRKVLATMLVDSK